MADPPPAAKPLPRADEATVSEEKVRGYLLNPDHATGSHKQRVFRAALGFGPDDWEDMREQLLTGVRTAVPSSTRPALGCMLYEVIMPFTGPNGAERDVLTV